MVAFNIKKAAVRMGKKKKYKQAREQCNEQYDDWTRFLKQQCHYYAITYLVLFFLLPFIFMLLFDITTAFTLFGSTWFIISVSYFFIFKHYAKSKNKDLYALLSKNRYGNGTMVSAVFQYARGGMMLMTILGAIGLYHWLK
jgi:hypothetical protein